MRWTNERWTMTGGRGLLVGLLAAALAAGSAFGQSGDRNGTRGGSGGGEEWAGGEGVSPVTVSEQLTIGPLGVTVFLPDGVEVSTNSVPGGRTTTTIRPGGGAGGVDWLMRVYNITSSDETITPAEITDSFIRDQTAKLDVHNVDFKLLHRQDSTEGEQLFIGKTRLPASRFYSTSEPSDGILSGYTIVRVAPGRFVVFQLATGAVENTRGRFEFTFEEGKPYFGNQNVNLFETVVASLEYEDPALARLEDARRFHTGAEVLESMDMEELKATIERHDEPVFLRVYEPAETGSAADAREMAFQKITYKLGQLGELEPRVPRGSWTPKQREFGFIVTVEAKAAQGDLTAETQARYFLSIDREEEFWVTTTVTRRDRASFTAREALIRRGNALTVTVTEDGQPSFTRDWNLAEHDNKRFYVSRVELYLLPLIVAERYGEEPTDLDMNFYAYDSAIRRLTQRTDMFTNRDISGWKYTSKRSPESGLVEAILDADGELIRRQAGEGQVVERTTRERLSRIWRNKDLPRVE